MEKCRTYKDGSKRQHVFTSCRSRNLWDISFFSFRGSGKPYSFSSRLLYNVLLLRCSAETAKIKLMVFVFILYCVVELNYGVSGV